MGSTWPIWVPPSHPFPSEGLKILDTNKTERRWSMAGWLNEWMDGRKEKGDLFMKKWNTVILVAIFLFSYSAKVCVLGLCPRRMQTCRTECQHFPWYAVVWVTDSLKFKSTVSNTVIPCYWMSSTYLREPESCWLPRTFSKLDLELI